MAARSRYRDRIELEVSETGDYRVSGTSSGGSLPAGFPGQARPFRTEQAGTGQGQPTRLGDADAVQFVILSLSTLLLSDEQ